MRCHRLELCHTNFTLVLADQDYSSLVPRVFVISLSLHQGMGPMGGAVVHAPHYSCSVADLTVYFGADSLDFMKMKFELLQILAVHYSDPSITEMNGRIKHTTRVLRGCTKAHPDPSIKHWVIKGIYLSI